MKESGEDYLETIYILNKRLDGVHAVDIASFLGFSKPSITRALGILKADGMIVVGDDNHIKLTEKGQKKAEQIYERHLVLTEFLMSLGVSKDTADKDACRIEHVISPETFEKIKTYKVKL